jgi:hypothetical protein
LPMLGRPSAPGERFRCRKLKPPEPEVSKADAMTARERVLRQRSKKFPGVTEPELDKFVFSDMAESELGRLILLHLAGETAIYESALYYMKLTSRWRRG